MTGAAFPIVLSDSAAMVLRLVCAHDGITEHQFISRAVVARAEAIGIADLAGDGALEPYTESPSRGGKVRHREPSRCLGPP